MALFQRHPRDEHKGRPTYDEVATFTFAAVLAIMMVTASFLVIGLRRASVLDDKLLLDEDEPLDESPSRQCSYDTFTGITYRADSSLTFSSRSKKVMAPTLTVPNMPPHTCSTAKQTLLSCSCIDRQSLDILGGADSNQDNLGRTTNDLENLMKIAAEMVKSMKLEPIADIGDFDPPAWLAALDKEPVPARAFYHEIFDLLVGANLTPKPREGDSPWDQKPIVYIAATLWLQAVDVHEVRKLIRNESIREYFVRFALRETLINRCDRSRGGNDYRGVGAQDAS